MFRLLWQKKALILFLAVLVILLPQAVSRPAQMMSKAVLTEITIDKENGEYTITGEMVVNKPGGAAGEQESETVTAKGPSVTSAINTMSSEQGREVSFAHCTLIIMGEGLADENFADLLQYFLHKTEISNNCALAYKEKGNGSTIEKFYKDYMRAVSVSVIAEGADTCAVFKNGKYAFSFDKTQTAAFNTLQSKIQGKQIVMGSNVLNISSSETETDTSLSNDIPAVNINVKIKAELESSPAISDSEIAGIKNMFQQKVKADILDMLKSAYSQNADILNLYGQFYRFNTERFKPYMENKTAERFMNNLYFNVNVDVSIIT